MLQKAANQGRTRSVRIVLAFAAIYVIWGTTYLAIRVAVETIPPFTMAGTRFVIAGVLVLVFLRLRGVPLPSKIQWRSAVVVGAFLLVGGNGLVTYSEQDIPSGFAAIIVATVPIWMMLFEWLLFRGTRPKAQVIAGIVIGFVGIFLLIGPSHIVGSTSFRITSLLILMLAPVLWSFGSLVSPKVKLPENIFMSTSTQMVAGGILLLLLGVATGEVSDLDVAGFSTRSLGAMLYLTLFGSIVAFTAYLWLLKNVESSKVSTYTYVNPAIAVFLGWLLLNEEVTIVTVVAILAIILSVMLITLRKRTAFHNGKESVEITSATSAEISAD